MNTSSRPLVSIVIPSYNYGQFLANTIRSVLEQTYTNIELIIVDNASTDDSLKIAQSFTSDPRVRVLQIEVNQGPVPAWNLGFQHVRGEWFAMLPADDYFEHTKIEKQIDYIRLHPEVTMLSTYVQQVDETGQPAQRSWIEPVVNIQPDYNNPEVWDWEHHFCIPTAIYSTALCRSVGPLSVGLHSVVDIEFHVRLMRKGGVAHVLPEKLTNYRWHSCNQSGKKNQKTAHQWVYYQITQLLPFAHEKGVLTAEFFANSLRKFFSQFYFLESSLNEAAAFLSCFHSWQDFGSRFPDFPAFEAYVGSYDPDQEPQAPFISALAEEIMKHHSSMQNPVLAKEYQDWLTQIEKEIEAKLIKYKEASTLRRMDIPGLYMSPRQGGRERREKQVIINVLGMFEIRRSSFQIGRKLKQTTKRFLGKEREKELI